MKSILFCIFFLSQLLFQSEAKAQNLNKKNSEILLDSVSQQKWDTLAKKFNDFYATKYYYDSLRNCTIMFDYVFDSSLNQWQYSTKTYYAYNSKGKIKSQITYYHGSKSNKWYNYNKKDFGYDFNGNIAYEIDSFFDNSIDNNWKRGDQIYYHYNNNKLLTKLDSSFNGVFFIELNKIEYLYDSNGNNINAKELKWEALEWKIKFNHEYIYDTNNINRAYIYSKFLTDSLSIPLNKFEFSSDNKYLVWYEFNMGNWNKINTSDIIWNGNITNQNISFPHDFNININNFRYKPKYQLLSMIDRETNQINFSFNRTFYYTPFFISGINQINKIESCFYPNPSKGIINFNVKEKPIVSINIFDLWGEIIIRKIPNENQGQITLDLSDLISGIYFIQLNFEGGGYSTSKLILTN